MSRRTREERVLGLKVKLAVQYGIIGFLFGMPWAWVALKHTGPVGYAWLSGLLSGVVCFLIFGEIIVRLFSYLADGTWHTLLSRSPDYSPIEKFFIGYLWFYIFHGALFGVVAHFVLQFALHIFEASSSIAWWHCGGGIVGLIPSVWYGWTEVE